MLWMEITSERMPQATEEADGVCLLPIGCLERHGPHLPLGTDQIVTDEVARRAAEVEPAVVFPSFYLGQIAEARHSPGAISLPHELLLSLLKAVLDEIGRNGFTKIIICNGHGGNTGLLSYLMHSMLQEPRDYVPYVCATYELEKEDAARWAEMQEAESGGHAGESETSQVMCLRPETVHLEDVKDPADWRSRDMQAALGRVENPFGWYSRFPTHFAGDPTAASPEKGEFLIEACVRRLVNVIRRVKADDVTERLRKEFHERAGKPMKKYEV